MNFASIAYVDDTGSGAISSNIFVAAVELVFSAVDNAVNCIARPARRLFTDSRAVARLEHCAVRGSAVTRRTP
jgi:hypothetical protein